MYLTEFLYIKKQTKKEKQPTFQKIALEPEEFIVSSEMRRLCLGVWRLFHHSHI